MFCGIDVGTQGVRVVIVDAAGRVQGEGVRPLTAGARVDSRHTQSATDWWDALVPAVREAVEDARRHGVQARDIAAVALDSTSGTVVVEDSHGIAVGPALMYDDARARNEAVRADTTGRDLWSALGYRIQPTWALPKILWLLEHADLPLGARIVHQGDHLAGRLAGHAVATDVSSALKTGANLLTATWPEEIFGQLGLSTDLLPNLVLPGRVIGAVAQEAADVTGLSVGTPIRAGMTDGCAAQIAAGALRPGQWSSALGTTLTIKGTSAELLHDPAGAVYCHRHPDGGWLPGGASSTGAAAISKAFPGAPSARLEQLTTLAAAEPIDGPAVYPLVGVGERFPFLAPDAVGFGLDDKTSDAARFAAICRGVAFVERLAYDVLEGLGADVSGTVALTGGASRNPWWNQLRTDVLGRVTLQPESAQAAVGMAVLAAAEPGALATTADRMVRIRERLEPDLARSQSLDAGYQEFVGTLAERGWVAEAHATSALRRVTPAADPAQVRP